MKGFVFSLVLILMLTSCRYSYNITNNYNCCPIAEGSWIDTIGVIGQYNVHVIGTRNDLNNVFKHKTITTIKGFRIVEVAGHGYTVEIINPNF